MEDTIEMAFNTEKGLEDTMNPFVSWANNIYEESQNHIEEGSGINPLYLPSIIPLLKKEIKLLPLWSAIMVPFFGYGKPTKLSAAVESMVNKIKNTTFNDIILQTNLESFIERCVTSLKGSALLKHGEFHTDSNIINTAENNDIQLSVVADQSLNG